MDYQISHAFSNTPRTLQIVVLGVGLFISMNSARFAALQAKPVTIEFNAIVGPPNTVSPFDVPFDMPFGFNEADIVRGQITFEPLDVPESTSYTIAGCYISNQYANAPHNGLLHSG